MTTLLLILVTLAAPPARADACRGCNVVLISLDTVGARHLGLYGAPSRVSPNLDEFAAKALVYENAYAPSPWTLPSHAAMLTGYYPWSMGIESGNDVIPESAPTLAQHLAARGYQTAAFVSMSHLSSAHGFHRGFSDFKLRPDGLLRPTSVETMGDGSSWLWTRKSSAPFFLFLHLFDAHEPHEPAPDSLRAIGEDATPALNLADIVTINGKTTPPGAGEIGRAVALYRAEINGLDRLLGELFRELERQDLTRNTLIIVTADHGQEMGEHGSLAVHGFHLYDEVLHVPLIYFNPRRAAKRLRSPVSLVDIVPSVLADLGLPAPAALQGRVLPRADARAAMDRLVFAQSIFHKSAILSIYRRLTKSKAVPPANDRQDHRVRRSAVIGKSRKLILNSDERALELYDLEKDPRERENLGSSCVDETCRMLRALAFSTGEMK